MDMSTRVKISRDPRMMAYHNAQERFVTRMVKDYGDNFTNGTEGVDKWTPAQEALYASLMRGQSAMRQHIATELANAS